PSGWLRPLRRVGVGGAEDASGINCQAPNGGMIVQRTIKPPVDGNASVRNAAASTMPAAVRPTRVHQLRRERGRFARVTLRPDVLEHWKPWHVAAHVPVNARQTPIERRTHQRRLAVSIPLVIRMGFSKYRTPLPA